MVKYKPDMVDYNLRQVIPIKINSLKFPGVPSQGFAILDHLDEQIRKLNNELEKENKVMCGVEVLIQTVNSDTSRRGELESQKGITERKIEELKRQLKKTEGKMNRIMFEYAATQFITFTRFLLCLTRPEETSCEARGWLYVTRRDTFENSTITRKRYGTSRSK
jgi:hypothetical protein